MKFELPNNLKSTSSGSADFVSLKKNKDSIRGVFAGEPIAYKQHWVGKGTPPVLCEGAQSGCQFCNDGQKASFRFRVNFITKENGALVSKIFEQGWNVWETIKDLNSKVDLERITVEITRMGEGRNDTRYTVMPILDGDPELSDEALSKIQAIQLKELQYPKATSKSEDVSFDTDEFNEASSSSEPLPDFDADDDLDF